jgi:type I restriction enzyme S subunit
VQIGPNTPGGVPIVPIKHLTRIDEAVLHYASPAIEEVYAGSRIKGGDILISVKGTIGEVGLVPLGFEGNIAREVARIRSGPACDPEYLAAYLEAGQTQKRISSKVVGSTRLEFSIHALRAFLVALPCLDEQRRIAGVARLWADAIRKAEQLLAAKERHYRHELSRLISRCQHPRAHIGTFAAEVSARNPDGNEARVLSVTNSRGFVLPEDQFERRVASADLSSYKVVRRGQYAYNPSRINVGSIARLDGWDNGVLSPMYVVFRLDEANVDSDYFLHWLNSHEARQRIRNSAQGGVRETVAFSEFAAIAIPLPALHTQTIIARYLNALREDIVLLGRSVAALKAQKRGLMQKLLTGQWRLPVPGGAQL